MKPMERRSFLKGSLVAAVAGAAGIPAVRTAAAEPETVASAATLKDSLKADVLVVGAGPSGVPAALAAARAGAKVILVEEDAMPGGAPVNMYVSMLCGGPRLGIFREMAELLNRGYELSGKPIENFNAGQAGGNNYWYLPSSYVQVINGMIAPEPNLQLICGARAVRALVSEGGRNRVRGIEADLLNGQRRVIEAAVTIDATGTGLIAHLAGCETRYGREAQSEYGEPFGVEKSDSRVQNCTLMFISQRLRKGAVLPLKELGGGLVENNLNHWLGKNDIEDGTYKTRDAGIYLHWGGALQCEDTRDPVCLADTCRKALGDIRKKTDVLRKAGYAVWVAPKLGVRECRRLVGEHVITVNDLKSGRQPDDAIALTGGGIDNNGTRLTEEQVRMPMAGIPYRALLPKNTEGLLVAGKSLSCTHFALGALRTQPVVAAFGQAAGVAASMAALNKTGLRDISVTELQQKLREAGLFNV